MRSPAPFASRIGKEYLGSIAARGETDLADLDAARAEVASRPRAPGPARLDDRIEVVRLRTPPSGSHPGTHLLIARPPDDGVPRPCVFWTQGGGFVIEDPTADEAWCRELAAAHDCIVVSVGWRRAPEHPYPAAIDDCYDGISWITDNAVELGIDRRRLIIAGNSSGGGLTASLALMIRDRGEINVIHQMLIYPMLDDRNESASSHMVTDSRLWDREKNAWAWKYYLGERFGAQDPAGHAVPARAEDLSGLCPTSILTGELDLFRDENVQYALRLFEAGVPTELHVYAGAPHGFDRLADSPTVRRFRADRDAIIGAALASTTSSKDATSG